MKTERGFVGRIGWRLKFAAVLVLVMLVAGSIVLAFAAGYATSAVLAEAGMKDKCAGIGTWDESARLCVKQEAAMSVTASQTGPVDMYACGNGASFTLQADGDARTFVFASSTTPQVLARDTAATATERFADGSTAVTLAGPEARLEDSSRGLDVACMRR